MPTRNLPNRILLVEDDLLAKESLAYILEFEGYNVATAGDGAEGLEILHQSPRPSAVVLDLGLPVMSGHEFLERQKKDPRVADIPVIVVTAAYRPRVPDASAVLSKPVDVPKLIDLLREHCAPAG
jgi:two-component system, chemotaxis family, chemotaxis protein CheY